MLYYSHMFSNLRDLSRNIHLMYLIDFLFGLTFFLPVWALYVQESLFTITNVAIIIAIQSVAAVLFEVPTGAVGDLFGRRKTIILGALVYLLSIVFLYLGGNMLMFILYAILSALGGALVSGTDSALIYDSLKENKQEQNYKKVIGTFHAIWPFGAVIGSIVGSYLAASSLSLPVIITFIPSGLACALTFLLKEPSYEKEAHKNILRHMIHAFVDIAKNKQILLLFIISFIVYGTGESIHLLKPIFFEFKEIPLVYFGYIFGVTFSLSSIGHYFSHDVSERIGNKMTLVLSVASNAVLILIATFTLGLASALFLVLPSISFGLRNPVTSHLLNLEVSSNKRATILSAHSLMQQLGKVVFAPFIGYFADVYTINTAFMISAIMMFIPLLFLVFLKERK